MNYMYAQAHTNGFNIIRWINSPLCFCQTSELVPVNMEDAASATLELPGGVLTVVWGAPEGNTWSRCGPGMNQGKVPRAARLQLNCKGTNSGGVGVHQKGRNQPLPRPGKGGKCVCLRN